MRNRDRYQLGERDDPGSTAQRFTLRGVRETRLTHQSCEAS